jgi:hypothetical protein
MIEVEEVGNTIDCDTKRARGHFITIQIRAGTLYQILSFRLSELVYLYFMKNEVGQYSNHLRQISSKNGRRQLHCLL